MPKHYSEWMHDILYVLSTYTEPILTSSVARLVNEFNTEKISDYDCESFVNELVDQQSLQFSGYQSRKGEKAVILSDKGRFRLSSRYYLDLTPKPGKPKSINGNVIGEGGEISKNTGLNIDNNIILPGGKISENHQKQPKVPTSKKTNWMRKYLGWIIVVLLIPVAITFVSLYAEYNYFIPENKKNKNTGQSSKSISPPVDTAKNPIKIDTLSKPIKEEKTGQNLQAILSSYFW